MAHLSLETKNFSRELLYLTMPESFSSFGKPSVLFLGELDELSFSVVQNLLERSCKVFLFSKNTEVWKRVSGSIKKNVNLELIKESEIPRIERLDYVIYLYNFFRAAQKDIKRVNSEVNRELLKISQKIASIRSKNLILLPAISGISQPLHLSGKRVYLSETIGPHIHPDNSYFIYAALKSVANKRKVYLPDKDIHIKPVFSESASEKILQILFSLGYPTEMTLVGESISPLAFIEKIKVETPELDKKRKRYRKYLLASIGEEISMGELEGVGETKDFLLAMQKPVSSNIKKRVSSLQKLSALVVICLFLPFLALITSAGLFGASITLYRNGKTSWANETLKVSRVFANTSSIGFGILGEIPKADKVLEIPNSASEILGRSAALAIRGYTLSQNTKTLLNKFFGDESYNVSDYSENISSEIDYIYKESGFILGEINSQPLLSKTLRGAFNTLEVERIRGMLIPISQIIENLPELLGATHPKKYLVLFQNNMELRPTGGYIGSFSLVSVEGGRLSNIEVWDVFEADGQLKGHVEPPLAIKRYLGEANWFLRDSNWDPDFSVSSARAEWFLDKEIDEKVDGVVGIDLEFVKSLISLTGPMKVADYELTVDEENLYEVTQREVEENFFPGSTKKSSFLTALSRALMENIREVRGSKMLSFAKNTLQNLEGRHIQIFIHQKETNDQLTSLGWDGAFPQVEGTCGNNCYTDSLGVVEANVGVNKANLYITRALDVLVNIENGMIKRELRLNLKNDAEIPLGEKGIYKVYVRAFGPQEAIFGKVKFIRQSSSLELEGEEQIVRDRKEVGVYVILSPQESGVLVFSWQSPLPEKIRESGEYRFIVRKQAGTEDYPLTIKASNFQESLTQEASFRYNAFLARDFVSRIYW